VQFSKNRSSQVKTSNPEIMAKTLVARSQGKHLPAGAMKFVARDLAVFITGQSQKAGYFLRVIFGLQCLMYLLQTRCLSATLRAGDVENIALGMHYVDVSNHCIDKLQTTPTPYSFQENCVAWLSY